MGILQSLLTPPTTLPTQVPFLELCGSRMPGFGWPRGLQDSDEGWGVRSKLTSEVAYPPSPLTPSLAQADPRKMQDL